MKLNLYTYFVFFLFALSANAQPFNTSDIAALNDFLLSTNGGSLSAPAGWNAALPTTQQWRTGNPETQWYGVTWTAGSVNRRVKIINLESTPKSQNREKNINFIKNLIL
jgi:hypothetical protein